MELKRFMTDLVDLGALGSGALRLHPRPVKLRSLLEGCLETVRPEAETKGLELLLDLAPATPGIVQADETRLRQVLLILLGNGIKFTAQGSVVLGAGRSFPAAVEERLLSHGAVCEGACLALTVRDTGPGLTSEDERRIAQLFSILDSAPRRFGTGLSLALAARLCAAMGGSLSVRRNTPSGSLFTVRLPLGIPVADPVTSDNELSPAMSGLQSSRSLSFAPDHGKTGG